MNRKYLSLLLVFGVLISLGCNKPRDFSQLDTLNLRGTYKVVYEAQEFIDNHGNLVSTEACDTEDIVVVSEEFFTWIVGNGKCSSKQYYENWPYYIAFDDIYMFSKYNKVEYWDGVTLRIVSDTNPANGRYVLELSRK